MRITAPVAAAAVAAALVTGTHGIARADAIAALEGDRRFDAFVAAARASGVDDVLAASDEGRTIFAPTDAAFARLPDDLVARLAQTDSGALRRVIARHIVPEGPYAADALPEQMATLRDDQIAVSLVSGRVVVSIDGGSEARVVAPGITGENVIVHGIDRVLLPNEAADAGEQALVAVLRGEADATRARDEPDGEDFVEAIAAVDEDRARDGLVPEPGETFDATLSMGDQEQLRLAAQDMTVITLDGDRRDTAPGLQDAGRIVTLPPETQERMVARLAGDTGPQDNRAGAPQAQPERTRSQASAPASGSNEASEPDPAPTEPEDEGEAPALGLSRDTVSVADLLGRDVRDPSGERLGEVEDVFLSLETGAAERIVVEVDAGFLGLFDRTTSVAPGAIAIDPLDGSVVVDRSALKSEGGDEGE